MLRLAWASHVQWFSEMGDGRSIFLLEDSSSGWATTCPGEGHFNPMSRDMQTSRQQPS